MKLNRLWGMLPVAYCPQRLRWRASAHDGEPALPLSAGRCDRQYLDAVSRRPADAAGKHALLQRGRHAADQWPGDPDVQPDRHARNQAAKW